MLQSINMKGIKDTMLRAYTRSLLIGLMSLLTCVAGSVHAQTAEQLQLFNSLDPAQQQSILQSMGQSGQSVPTSSTVLERTAGSARVVTQIGGQASSISYDEKLRYSDRLRAGDALLISLSTTNQVGGQINTGAQVGGSVVSEGAAVYLPSNQVPLSDKQSQSAQAFIKLVEEKNPYVLDRDGNLQLPGLRPIALAGLTVGQAVSRLGAENALNGMSIKLTYSTTVSSGVDALKPYGYDLFDHAPSTFAPVTDVPVPADYIVGSGDQLQVQLYGTTNRSLRLVVGRDGMINFPELGPITVGGKSFSSLQAELESRVAKQMIGVRASISMGETRSIRVFVLGEANLPGSYTVSGLSTMTSALFASGGIKPIGSLRNIQLKRQGAVVRTLDLYDLLMKGDTSNDAKLMPGDVIYIPTVGSTVSVSGEVRRPAIYELKGTQTANDVITLAGGLTSDADINKISLIRTDALTGRSVIDVNLNAKGAARAAMHNGDLVSVSRISPTLSSGVMISGHVHTPRSVAWHQGLRLTDVIGSVDELKPNADLHYVLIRREIAPDRLVAVLSADLSKALSNKGGPNDVVLQVRDRITVFDFESDRAPVIKPILNELRLQSQLLRPTETVNVGGRVKVAGEYPLEPGMKVSDLIRAGGGLQYAAYATTAELVRHSVDSNAQRQTQLINVDLSAIFNGNANADLILNSGDELNIKELPLWTENSRVTLSGEVRFPGVYTLMRGERLSSLLKRAGGVTDLAYLEGAVFTREEIRLREQEQVEQLAARMQADLALIAVRAAQANQQGAESSLTTGQQLLSQLKATKSVGRLVIDLEDIVDGKSDSQSDLLLKDGDQLVIPRLKATVSVIGEVQSPISQVYSKDLVMQDYVDRSGGLTKKADAGQIYIVHSNGSVNLASSGWFAKSAQILPGDTIVVPMDAERMPQLPMWQAVTQIIYNTAIAAAAIHSF